ncbi:hypothetical protein L6252_03175 [Candidatus Parcubacteria bacterium]|nr:hypothetical protein [Candidatus Parcubacteria bacterium]
MIEAKSKTKASELGLMALVLMISFLIVLGVSFAFKAALSFLEQKNLAQKSMPNTELASKIQN